MGGRGGEHIPYTERKSTQGKCPSHKRARPPLKNPAQLKGRRVCAWPFCLFHSLILGQQGGEREPSLFPLLHFQSPVTSNVMRTSTVKKVFWTNDVHHLKAGHCPLSLSPPTPQALPSSLSPTLQQTIPSLFSHPNSF